MMRPIPPAGIKRKCSACAAKFYDLDRRLIVCPKCNTESAESAPVVS